MIDQVWTEDTTDTYADSYMYRKDSTGPDGAWVSANWTIPGNLELDGLDAAGHTAAIPFGTYAIPEPSTILLMGLTGLAAFAALRRKKK